MGHSTHYLGYLTIDPPLNAAETSWLRAFTEWSGGPGRTDPYEVPDNPRAEWRRRAAAQTGEDGVVVLDAPAVLPTGIADWVISADGTMIRWREQEKSNDAAQVISYLTRHFLVAGALAATSGLPQFAEFTFDHHVTGVIAVEHGGSGELFLLHVLDTDIGHETVVPAVNHFW